MPVLILLGIGAIYGIATLKDRCTSSKKYDINISEQEKTRRVIEINQNLLTKLI